MDFTVTLRSVPPWMSTYSSEPPKCVHKVVATLKVEDSETKYNCFMGVLRSLISRMQWTSLEYVFASVSQSVSLMCWKFSEKTKVLFYGKRDAPLRV